MRYTQAGSYVNNETITDGVEIDAPGVVLTNSSSGRIVGGVRFLQGGSTLVNELGGIIRVADGVDQYSVAAVVGSGGSDTFVNNGLLRGLVQLGDGDDRYVKGANSYYGERVDLGAGDDVLQGTGGASWASAEGGAGFDRVEFSITNRAPVYGAGHGEDVTGFEELLLTGNGQYFGFSGYQSIRLGTPLEGRQNLIDSLNPLVDLDLNGNSLSLVKSSLKSIVGTSAAEDLELSGNTVITSRVSMGGGNDQLSLLPYEGLMPVLPLGGIDGGEGTDVLLLRSIALVAYDLATVTGFEELNLTSGYLPGTVDLANADGLARISLTQQTSLTLRSSQSSEAQLEGGQGGSIVLDEGTSVARYVFSRWSAQNPADGPQGDDTRSVSLTNHGTVRDQIIFEIGDDVYDGSRGFVGGTVFGNAGNDTLIGGSAAERFEGGYGADRLYGGGGADTLLGGAGNDIFGGTLADLAGDVVPDFSAGDRIHVTDAVLEGLAWEQVGTTLNFGGGGSLTLGTGGKLRLSAESAAGGGVDLVVAHLVAAGDSSGDGFSDILWRNTNGTLTIWNGTGGRFDGASGSTLAVSNTWQVAGTGDFNGDGRADLLWRHDSGTVTQWLSAGSGFNGMGQPSLLVGHEWQVAGTGDFDGDGRDDILWRNNDGTLTRWLGTGSGFDGAGQPSLKVSADWKIAGTGDFNGDGTDDILWRNDDGRVTRWLGARDGFDGAGQPRLAMSNAWQVADTGDFNGDGRDDILWRADDGRITRWLGVENDRMSQLIGLDNGFQSAGQLTLSAGKDWQVADTGDYNGDGLNDILWRHTDGSLTYWAGTSSGFDGATGMMEHVDASWSVFGG